MILSGKSYINEFGNIDYIKIILAFFKLFIYGLSPFCRFLTCPPLNLEIIQARRNDFRPGWGTLADQGHYRLTKT